MTIYEYLNKYQINYEEIVHNPVFTVNDALKEDIPNRIQGVECKNLFVKSKRNYYLIFSDINRKIDLKSLAKLCHEKNLHFASFNELKLILDLEPGSVTPLGIINDSSLKVRLLLDKNLVGNKVLLHPNTNTRTMSIEYDDLIKIIKNTNHEYLNF